jgi:hypothetical protein
MINFLGLNGRTSGLIRGEQIASKIEKSTYSDISSLYVGPNKVSIIVRGHSAKLASLHKKSNKIVGYDICDMPVGDILFRESKDLTIKNYLHDVYDFYIVNNDICANEAKTYTSKPVFVIPHHTANFENKKIEINSTVKRVGYVGLPEQISHASAIEDFCKKNNIEFINIHPSTREECDNVFMSIDIGIVFFDENTHSQLLMSAIKKYKPNIKLSNFQSYGIPTISVEYESYNQFGENLYIKVKTLNDFFENLKLLINDVDYRKSLSDNSYLIAKKTHIDEVALLYKKMVNELEAQYL